MEDAPLFGGVKVVLHQANLLVRRGHRVTIVCPTELPGWYATEAEHLKPPSLKPAVIPAADVTVATYWTTLRLAVDGAQGEIAHFCQGLEGMYTHNRDEHAAIQEVYQLPIPAMAVSPHLVRYLSEELARPARLVPQALEPHWRSGWRWGPRSERPRILVMSPFEIDWKGVATSLEAVRELRRRGLACTLVRLSQWPLSDEERELLEPDEYHQHLHPCEVPALMRGCDLLLAASWEQEGFGLPVLEAMACGLPVVASDISSFREFAPPAAELVPFDRPQAFADAAWRVLKSSTRWRQMRRKGRVVARPFAEKRSAEVAERVLQWVVSGAWREER